jgi:hypothetical protein
MNNEGVFGEKALKCAYPGFGRVLGAFWGYRPFINSPPPDRIDSMMEMTLMWICFVDRLTLSQIDCKKAK